MYIYVSFSHSTLMVSLLYVHTFFMAAPTLAHNYFNPKNYSLVRLTCREGFSTLNGAKFQRNGRDIADQVTLLSNSGRGTVQFSFNQNEEGEFTCSINDAISTAIVLAGYNSYCILAESITLHGYRQTLVPARPFSLRHCVHYIIYMYH